jgi:hypothetical protein
MTITEFETYCDVLIKHEILHKPKSQNRKNPVPEQRVWVDKTIKKLRKLFDEAAKRVDETEQEQIKDIIELKILKFKTKYL